ncbi:hypothetical protein DPMN_028578 [Dreissena polymorpha]|uniref:Uncharacterized protein n=1 Tax=Dreissena polymorpha TaxID=45954 RepID=A0A9D4LVN9_DREPO|nr:hypothetical protein DPMN_028578 [Dreissena polymorpha]
MVPRPSGHLQETKRQFATVLRPSGQLQETQQQCTTVPPDRLTDILRRHQTVSFTVRDDAKDFKTVYDGFRQCPRQSVTVPQTLIPSLTVPETSRLPKTFSDSLLDGLWRCQRLPDSIRRCKTVSQTSNDCTK